MIGVLSPQRNQAEHGLHLMNPRRHLKEVVRLLENTFGDVIDKPDRAPLHEMRWLAALAPWLGGWVLAPGIYGLAIIGFVWLEEGHVVGHAMVHQVDLTGERWQISNVAVAPPYRNRGIGRALMTAALDYIRARRGVWAILQVRSNNEPAIHLYRSLGFSPFGGETRWKLEITTPPTITAAQGRKLHRVEFRHEHEVEALRKHCFGEASAWWWQDRMPSFAAKSVGHWIRRLIGRAVHQRRGFWYHGRLIAFADIYVDKKYQSGEFLLLVDRTHWGQWEKTLLLEILQYIYTWGGRTAYTQTPSDYPPLRSVIQSLGFQERFHLLNMRKPLF